jgi:hypothetical protein
MQITKYSAPSVYRPPFYRQPRLSPKFEIYECMDVWTHGSINGLHSSDIFELSNGHTTILEISTVGLMCI